MSVAIGAARTVDPRYREEYREELAITKPDRKPTYASRLRAGETLFFPGRNQTSFAYLARMAARLGAVLVTRVAEIEGERGILIWIKEA